MIPEFLKDNLLKMYDQKVVSDIIKSYNNIRNTTIRINTLKATPVVIKEVLSQNNINYQEVSWSPFSLIIEGNNLEKIKSLSIYEEGKIYIQSLSSQLPPLFLEPQPNETILDMTASPGGKTTEIAMLSENKSMITAIEKNKIRYSRLQYNIAKQGAKKITTLNTDARHLDEYFLFDKILLDAPCSGSGTLKLTSLKDFTEDLVSRSIKTQKELIEVAVNHLKPNGTLIYSTCSILKSENEEVINYILKKYPNLQVIPLSLENYTELPKLPVTIKGTLCLKPTTNYEGFFVAKIVKK